MINRKKKASASGSGGSATTIQRAPTPPRSIVELCGKHAGRCGYCKTSSNNSSSGDAQGKGKGDGNGKGGSSKKAHTSATFGLSAKCLLCEDYQALIDLGWRRSGTYLYRPINAETCCPCYTIRLQADQFQPSRSQRQLRGRMERLMASSSSIPSSASSVSSSVAEALDTSGSSKGQGQQPMKRRHRAAMSSSSSSSASQQQEADTVLPRLEAALREAVRAILKEEEGVEEEKDEATAWTPLLATVRVQRVVAHAHSSTHLGDYSSPTALALTAQLRKRAQGQQAAAAAATPALAQRLLIHLLPLASSLGLRSIKAAPNGFLNFFLLEEQKGGGRVVAADAMGAVHALRTPTSSSSSTTTEEGSTMDVDEATGGVGGGRKGEPAVAMEEEEEEEGGGGGTTAGPFDFVVETVPPKVTEEVFALYRKYQVAVHGDKPEEVTKEGFNRFLVQSPLVSSSSSSSSSSSPYLVPYGSYHQLYRLNGKLVAVGVVDILPKCLSSVYCFYDPDYRHLSLVSKALPTHPPTHFPMSYNSLRSSFNQTPPLSPSHPPTPYHTGQGHSPLGNPVGASSRQAPSFPPILLPRYAPLPTHSIHSHTKPPTHPPTYPTQQASTSTPVPRCATRAGTSPPSCSAQ